MTHQSDTTWVKLLVPPAIGAVVGGIIVASGWFVDSKSNKDLSIENERRQLMTRYLIEASRNIADASHRDLDAHYEKRMALEGAISDEWLLESPEETKLARKIANNLKSPNGVDFTELLKKLRQELHLKKNLITTQAKRNLSSRSGIGGVLSAT